MSRAGRLLTHPLPLWIGFLLVHVALGAIALGFPGGAGIGDVRFIYPAWLAQGFEHHVWVGLQTPWVYPILALPPMIAADAFGPEGMGAVWLVLVTAVDAAAFGFVTGFGRDRRTALVAWWWLAFLLLLGPIALTRIDSFATPAALVGVLLLARAPRAAGVLLAIGAWIKVWPAALVVAAVVAVRRRLDVLLGALALSAVVVAGVLLLGGGANLFAFVTAQSDRGLQIEAGLATPWLWVAAAHPDGPVSVYYDTTVLTYQVAGVGVPQTAALATPLLVLTVGAVLVLGVLAARRGAAAAELLPALALGFTTALIVANKVGSPQYVGWLAVPIALGLAARASGHGRRFTAPAVLALATATLTQLVYPLFYDDLLALQPATLAVLTLRNLLLLALFVDALVLLVGLVRRPRREAQDGEWLPDAWPFRTPRSRES